MTARKPGGFTLIEILVALAIVAITLTAGLQATGALARAAQRESSQWLAQICAENELARIRLTRQLPDVGQSQNTCQQIGHSMDVQVSVLPTPNPHFRRIDVVVMAAVEGTPVRLLSLSSVMGRY